MEKFLKSIYRYRLRRNIKYTRATPSPSEGGNKRLIRRVGEKLDSGVGDSPQAEPEVPWLGPQIAQQVRSSHATHSMLASDPRLVVIASINMVRWDIQQPHSASYDHGTWDSLPCNCTPGSRKSIARSFCYPDIPLHFNQQVTS